MDGMFYYLLREGISILIDFRELFRAQSIVILLMPKRRQCQSLRMPEGTWQSLGRQPAAQRRQALTTDDCSKGDYCPGTAKRRMGNSQENSFE